METHQAGTQSSQTSTRSQQDEPILSCDQIRPVSPLESEPKSPSSCLVTEAIPPDSDKPPSESVIGRACTRFYNFWKAFLLMPWKMFLLLFTGTVSAIGHHFFYRNLNGKEGDAQSLMFRYGTILAFCAKASFGTAVAMAFQQRAWFVMRRKTARLDTVDSIFTANAEFTALLDWKAIKKARVSTCLALYCWLTPLVVVLTSETLSTVAAGLSDLSSCSAVRTLDFSNEETRNPRDPLKINHRYEMSLSWWNKTAELGPKDDPTKDRFEYWAEPSPQYSELILPRVISQGQPATRKGAGLEICSESWNCSYTIDFVAPAYKCEELASGVGSKVKKLGDSKPPFDTSIIAPEGNFTYFGITDQGEYGFEQVNSRDAGIPVSRPPYPKNLGAFRTEPIIWIGYATVNDTSVPQPSSRAEADWDDAYNPVIFGCEHYEAKHSVKFEYVKGVQSHKVISREYLRKVVDTTYLPDELDPDKRLTDRTVAIPEENYVFPSDLRKYRRTAAYHSLGYGLRAYLAGGLSQPNAVTTTNIYLTALNTYPNYLPVNDLPQAIEKLYEDIIISLLSEPTFIAVSWASNGKPSGDVRGGPETSYPCYRTRPGTIFVYDAPQLAAVYLASFALALVGVLLGLQAVREEGLMRDMKPSSIIETTRAPSLDELVPRGGLDKDKVRVGYGLVQQHDGESFRSFGLEGSVVQKSGKS